MIATVSPQAIAGKDGMMKTRGNRVFLLDIPLKSSYRQVCI
jgi:hypothetical protein